MSERCTDLNPYSAPKSDLGESEPDARPGDESAPRIIRLLATTIDFGLYVGLWWSLEFARSGRFEPPTDDAIYSLEGGLILMVFFAMLAANLYWLRINQQTIGKRLLRIKLVRGDGTSRVSLKRILLMRFFPVYLLASFSAGLLQDVGLWAYIPPIFLASAVEALPIFGPQRKCVHDYIADTMVIRD